MCVRLDSNDNNRNEIIAITACSALQWGIAKLYILIYSLLLFLSDSYEIECECECEKNSLVVIVVVDDGMYNNNLLHGWIKMNRCWLRWIKTILSLSLFCFVLHLNIHWASERERKHTQWVSPRAVRFEVEWHAINQIGNILFTHLKVHKANRAAVRILLLHDIYILSVCMFFFVSLLPSILIHTHTHTFRARLRMSE